MRTFVRILIAVIVIGGLAYGGWVYWQKNQAPAVSFKTTPVKRGELLATISATGTIEPEEVVDVGAQVAGQILSFGDDAKHPGKQIDYNSEVEQGTVLARIDDVLYASDVESAKAALESSKAAVERAQADIKQYDAKLKQAENDWNRAKDQPLAVMSQADKDAFEAAYYTGLANVAVAKAALAQAEKGVPQAEAVLNRAKRNLSFCTITSPVKGVIIDRRVNVGQTVVSSLNAPSLFLIAKDLTKVQVWASVNEADIGNIHEGQTANFTVDTFPGRTFKGKVGKIRLNATMTQNVVTYVVEVDADNSDGTLKPYLTANVQFEVARHDNAVLVPNVALRWVPSTEELVTPDARGQGGRGGPGGGGGGRPGGGGGGAMGGGKRGGPEGNSAGAMPQQHRGTLYVKDGEFVKPIKVKIGNTDGTNTEILSNDVKEGDEVVTSEVHGEAGGDDAARNPFLPQFGRRR